MGDDIYLIHLSYCTAVWSRTLKNYNVKWIHFFKNMKLLQYILLESLTVLLHIINEITASFTFLYSTAVSFQSFPKTLFLNKLYTTHHLNHFAAKKKKPRYMSKSKLHVARPSEHTVLPAKLRRSLRLYGTPPYYNTKIINEIIKRY